MTAKQHPHYKEAIVRPPNLPSVVFLGTTLGSGLRRSKSRRYRWTRTAGGITFHSNNEERHES